MNVRHYHAAIANRIAALTAVSTMMDLGRATDGAGIDHGGGHAPTDEVGTRPTA